MLLVSNCANRGTPTGGEKDTEPPTIKYSTPENYTTNFKSNEIVIHFNEYVKIKDAQKQLIISPPMQIKPEIYPLGGASKYISIKIKDTLQANTTYAFNFGESIVDHNEGNPYSYYKFVFSTGNTIDSLSVKGYVEDALSRQPDTFVSVMLYEADSTYKDSVVYKQKPRYITNTLDSLTTFSIDNIKAGKYKLIALKDENSNYTFEPKTDKIGFKEGYITVPTDSVYGVKLFNEQIAFKAFKPKQVASQRLMFPYEGDYENIKIKVLENQPKNFEYRLTKDSKTDTLYYWYTPNFEVDTTFFKVEKGTYVDTLKHRFKNLDADSLTIKAASSAMLNLEDEFAITANIPFKAIDTSKLKLIDKDSTAIKFEVVLDSLQNQYRFPFKTEENQQYSFTIYPEAITDFFNTKNTDTLNFGFRTKLKSQYGNIRVQLRNAKFPLIVQLIDKNGKVYREQYTTKNPVVDFENLEPRLYDLRVIFDTNKNGVYDTGNFLLGIQPERVSYCSPPLEEVRASFDFIYDFTLQD